MRFRTGSGALHLRAAARVLAFVCALLGAAAQAAAADESAPPALASASAERLSELDAQTLRAWTLARPEFRAHVGSDRLRLLRMGIDQPKAQDGQTYPRATLYFRNYARGLAHRVYVRLDTGALEIDDLTSLVQPSREELEAAWDILRADPALERYFSDPTVEVSGGFYERSRAVDDPCARDVCVLIEVLNRRPGQGFARQVVVNLSRENIANRDFRTPPDSARPNRMSAAPAPESE